MKKHIIVAAAMSVILTFAGCGRVDELDSITKDSFAESVTVSGSSETNNSFTGELSDSKSAERKPEEQKKSADGESGKKKKSDKKKKADDNKTDTKKETAENTTAVKIETTGNRSEVKKETAAVNNSSVSDINDIIGDWYEVGGADRCLTVWDDSSFELTADDGYLIASGTVTVEIKDGVKNYSFIDSDRGLWYVPFELTGCSGEEVFLQTQDNPVYGPDDTVKFSNLKGNSGNTGYNTDGLEPVFGTWYDQDCNIGRELTVNGDGTYTIVNSDGGTENGYVAIGSDDLYELRNDRGECYSFYLVGEGQSQQLIEAAGLYAAYTSSFGRSPSNVTAVNSIEKIAGEWYPVGPTDDYSLIIRRDGTYSFIYSDGSEKTNTIGVAIRDGVVKYTFHDDMYGTWLVPFELRTDNLGEVLVTEENPVYDELAFRR